MTADMDKVASSSPKSRDRLLSVDLDRQSTGTANPSIEHEREVAIFDLLDGNSFAVDGRDDGPYKLSLSIVEDRLVFDIGTESGDNVTTHSMGLSPFKKIIKDYFIICDTYYEAIKSAAPSHIQEIDKSRRELHDEGSKLLAERLKGKITVDFDTARRLFTLLCALHWKG